MLKLRMDPETLCLKSPDGANTPQDHPWGASMELSSWPNPGSLILDHFPMLRQVCQTACTSHMLQVLSCAPLFHLLPFRVFWLRKSSLKPDTQCPPRSPSGPLGCSRHLTSSLLDSFIGALIFTLFILFPSFLPPEFWVSGKNCNPCQILSFYLSFLWSKFSGS